MGDSGPDSNGPQRSNTDPGVLCEPRLKDEREERIDQVFAGSAGEPRCKLKYYKYLIFKINPLRILDYVLSYRIDFGF